MRCPACIKQGVRSRVDWVSDVETVDEDRSPQSRTPPQKSQFEAWYDDTGRVHIHSYCYSRTWYRCKNGHFFSVVSASSCGCGWTIPAKVVITKEPKLKPKESPEDDDVLGIPDIIERVVDPKIIQQVTELVKWPDLTAFPDPPAKPREPHVRYPSNIEEEEESKRR